MVTFVPSDDLSSEPKVVVTVPGASVEGRQIQAWVDEFTTILSGNAPLGRIVHAGGGDFTFFFADGTHCQLSARQLSQNQTQRIYDGLQYLSQAAENAYRIVQVNLSRSA